MLCETQTASRQLTSMSPPHPVRLSVRSAKKALKDKRGRLLKPGVKYAAVRRPKVWILEKVSTLATWKKFKHIKNGLVSALEKLGYVVHVKVLHAQK